jgi:POT family proton-dependent oligopeptide transporter
MATIIFFLGRKKYVRVPPSGPKRENFMVISYYAILQLFKKKDARSFWDRLGVEHNFSAKSIDGVQAVYRILMIFAFTPIFWAMWDQNLAEWVLQAKKLDLHILGYELFAEQIQTFNPIFLVSMIPVMTYGVFPLCEKLGITPTPLRKIGAGLFLTGLTFVIIAFLQTSIDQGGHPSVWWQILAYLILAIAEILVSITCLEYAYTHSPKSMKSTMSALYLLGISLGNYFDSLVNKSIANNGFFAQYTGAKYYWLFIGIITVFFVIYLFIAKRLPEKSYVGLEEAEPAKA